MNMKELKRPRAQSGAFVIARKFEHALQAGIWVVLAAMLTSAPAARGQCIAVQFNGTVAAKQTFQKRFTKGLIFRLVPEGDGWSMEVRPAHDRQGIAEYSYIVTPPYRTSNPRYIYTGWDITTLEQVLAMKKRDFAFVLDRASYLRADVDLRHILWSAAKNQYQQGLDDMSEIPVGGGELTITDAKIGRDPAQAQKPWIAEMAFTVKLTVPSGLKIVRELRKSAVAAPCPKPAP